MEAATLPKNCMTVICGNVHTGSWFADLFVEPRKETYVLLFNQIIILNITLKHKNFYMYSLEIPKQ